ncbi:hypothetical protein KAX97_08200 [candidate division WOR-3 bacterium]|nr:hypothetical protein [candidate division WOR-3 bacterium]
MRTNYVLLAGFVSLGIAVAAGLVTSLWVIHWTVSLTIGLVVFFLSEVFCSNIVIKKMQIQYKSVSTFFDALRNGNRFSELRLLYGFKQSAKLFESSIQVDKENATQFWRECITRAETAWRVINYAATEDTWDIVTKKKIPFHIQEDRIQAKCSIERIFLVDSEKELNEVQRVMKAQKNVGIKVYGILREDLGRDIVRRLKKLISFDFAVVDENWVYFTRLDKRRRIIGGAATCDKTRLREASYIFKEVRRQAVKKARVKI